MPDHPFTHAYIGLGLLDDASIIRRRDCWAAEYRDAAGAPYLVVYAGPRLVRIEEFQGGKRVARTVDTTMLRAIGNHGQNALGGDLSRFWQRVAQSGREVWIQLSPSEVVAAYVPAIGLGHVCIPVPLGRRWHDPAPGPLARRLDFAPFRESTRVTQATLLRFVADERRPREERVRLHQASMPGILVAEAVAAYYAANGPLRSIEWRPFVLPEPVTHVGRTWEAPPPAPLPDGAIQQSFAIIEDAR